MKDTHKICFFPLAYSPNDERVWFHQADLLKDNGFVSLTNPNDDLSILPIITDYMNDHDRSYAYMTTSLEYATQKYNRELISDIFLQFLTTLCD